MPAEFLQIYFLVLLNLIQYASISTQEIQSILLQLPCRVSNPKTGEENLIKCVKYEEPGSERDRFPGRDDSTSPDNNLG